jgi:hypothetical protein
MDSECGTNTSEITESILLDTTTAASWLAVTVQATGASADALRQQLESPGREQFEQERLEYFAKRYASAKRQGKIRYRDQRDINELTIVEVFEINGFLKRDPKARLCTFQLPGNAVIDALKRPPPAPDSPTPVPLPHPCDIIHTFEVQAATLQPMAAPRFALESAYLRFSRRQKSRHKYWSMTLNLTTLGPEVPPHHRAAHEKLVAQISQESVWNLLLPAGIVHPRRPPDFGQLPPAKPADKPTPASRPERPRAERSQPRLDSPQGLPPNRAERRRVRSMRTKYIVGLVIVILSILIIGYLLYFMAGVRQIGM